MIKGIAIGFVLGVAAVVGGLFSYFVAGLAPVATADPPMQFEKKLANMSLDAHIDKQPSDYATTMYPKPTQLFLGKGVTDDPAAESYWKAANGIRLPGMPAFRTKLNDTQPWQVSQLVAHANEISESVKSVLVSDTTDVPLVPALTTVPTHQSPAK